MSKLKIPNKKLHSKGNYSYNVSPIVAKIAQQIDLVLNDLRFIGILIFTFIFDLFSKKNYFFIPMFFINSGHIGSLRNFANIS